MALSIFWFRQDLRLSDNPGLSAAVAQGSVIPVYIWDETDLVSMGAASKWWLHHSLSSLMANLRALGSSLCLRRGDPKSILLNLMQQTGATGLYLNRCYEPHTITRDSEIKKILEQAGLGYHSFNGVLLHEPWEIRNKESKSFQIFTPFWKACLAKGMALMPMVAPKSIVSSPITPTSDSLDDWPLLPSKPDWAGGLRQCWQVGEDAAQGKLKQFLENGIHDYASGRDFPSQKHTSLLSPHLRWGEISPRQVYFSVESAQACNLISQRNADKFLSEIGWREFSYHLLYHHPTLPHFPLQSRFQKFPWQVNPQYLRAWQKGITGVPMVDAGMRELWQTGTMHNRVRMITASFLVKNLLQPWQDGAAWFWDTLCDADLANNSASWQWVAGCGADAAPYFRVFNPVLQGQKFDPEGHYIRQWVPELRHLDNKFIHQPWAMPTPPATYPPPIVDLMQSRDRALRAFEVLKGQAS